MSNFKKRLSVSVLAFPLIYVLLYQKTLSNLLILIVFLFCLFEWVKIFKKKNAIFFLGLIVLFAFLLSLLRIYNFEEFKKERIIKKIHQILFQVMVVFWIE